MGEDPRPYPGPVEPAYPGPVEPAYPEPVELAEALWLHAYRTTAARLPPSDRPPQPRPATPPGLSGLPDVTDITDSPETVDRPGRPEAPGTPEPRRPSAPPPTGNQPPATNGRATALHGGAEGPLPGSAWLLPASPPATETTGGAPEYRGAPARTEPLAPAPDLRDASGIGRRLRPLKQVVPSASEIELDEEATAEHAAEDGLWLPYTRAAGERRFDLVLVVDDHATMVVWQQTIAEFTAVAEQLGAFRDVRVRRMGVREGPAGPEAVLRGPVPEDRWAGAPGELVDRTGRRIILVLTDGLGPLWRTGAGRAALGPWAAAGPVAVVHLLSQRDWHRTALTPRQARLRAPRTGARTAELAVDFPAEWYDPFDPPPERWTAAVPVLELDADWLGRWAALVAGDEPGWTDAPVLLLGVPERPATEAPEPSAAPPAPSVRERIRRFRGHATPTAFRLATHLAAAVLEPRLVRDVQRKLVPEAQPVHLAELFLSGLLEQAPAGEPPAEDPRVPLDFVAGAREELLSAAMRADTARVVSSVSDFYGDRVEAARRLHGALLAPDKVPVPAVTAESLPFVRVELAVLRALSGPYLLRARRVSAALEARSGASVPENTEPIAHDGGNAGDVSDAGDASNASDTSDVSDVSDERINSDTDGQDMTETTANEHQRDDRGTANHTPARGIPAPSLDGRPAAGSPSHGGPVPDGDGASESHAHPARGSVPAVWGNVPPNNPNFVGREDLLDQVREQLVTGDTSAVLPHALHGMGGVGKSQIAIEYVYRHASDYDVVWWIPSEQPTMILTALTELAHRLGLNVSSEANRAVPAVREALRRGHPYSRWLLVFDNAENVEAVRPYFPTGGTGKILITSRNQEWDRVAETLSVDVFTREESKALLRRRARDLTDRDADRLAEALGDLPLAIEQAAAWQAVTGMSVPEYLRLINEKIAELMLELVPSPDYPMSVAAAWDVSLRQLEQRNPAALQLLQVCSFFAPEPISRSLFNNSRTTTIAPELDEALRHPIKLGRAIREINVYALARIEHRHDTIQLHRLVQAVLVNRMSPQQQADMRHGAHLLLADANPNSPGSREMWPRYQALLPHVVVSRAVECDSPWVRGLVRGMVEFLYVWGDHDGAAAMAREALRIWTEKFGAEDQQTLEMAKWLAFILRMLGEYREAAEMMQRTADLYISIAGEDDEGTLDALIQLCSGLRLRAELARALEINRSVYDRSLRAFGDDDPATLRAAHSLGVGLRLMGLYQEARELDTETSRLRALALGENHLDTLNTLSGLSIDVRETGDYLGAVTHQEDVYARYVENYGEDTPVSVSCARVLAVCRRRAGDHDGALQLGEMALSKFESRYGADHPDAVACAANLVVDLRQDGQLRRSRELGEATVERYTASLGESHPYTLSARTNLAITLRHLGDLAAAGEHLAAALPGLRASLGDEHILTLTTAMGTATQYDAEERHPEALDLDRGTLDALTRIFGETHPTALACANNVVLDLRALGRDDEATALHTETLTRFRRVLGESHPATVAAASSKRAEVDIAPVPF
ncbi:FxSxx-COOH system tetratricopeptide repeat protein [Streptomyces sp. LP11]|uniref:FxSxx-COOH system tetratricopeptide repeat protein n=1 Tax=Streptomyces pyxinicus TaxID=2970331 RepID=A0ABT2AYS0_9ACTN|nr:FxSxx-COOH system tetratricopeptide repeat protein [Streptomyces sp. LP11]MCS0601375.1 FxSxx-COOH system tetratricopeptide repeat protein [Streptomyces sp. LP11]